MRTPILLTVLALSLFTSGCTRLRFVIDTMPADEAFMESTVIDDGGASDKIALIDVTGLIADANRPGLLAPGENPVSHFTESLQRARRDGRVKAVVIRINSPGGTVTASDVMHGEVMRFKAQSGKPVVIAMADVAASGGYYLACAGDEIIAHPTTITGSIGVIIQTFNVSDGMSRIGIRADAITSGPNKAVGSPFAPMPPEHRALLQGLVDEFYTNFTTIVKTSRPALSASDIDWVTDGRVVTGRKAAEVGLVDRLGDLHDAFEAAKKRAGISAARLVKYHRPIEYVGSAYADAPTPAASQFNLLQLNVHAPNPLADPPGFYYLWDPSIW